MGGSRPGAPRAGRHLPNKTDSADALALAAYLFDQEHLLESGELNPKYFLMHRPHPIDELRAVCLCLEHNNKSGSSATTPSSSWLGSGRSEKYPKARPNLRGCCRRCWPSSRSSRSAVARRVGRNPITAIASRWRAPTAREIDPYLREQARILAVVHDSDKRLEAELERLVDNPCFDAYHAIARSRPAFR